MELKPYQKYVLDDLSRFLKALDKHGGPRAAFNAFWEDQLGKQSPGISKSVPQYYVEKEAKNMYPQVCFKVPTAGGKTFIACNAVQRLLSIKPADAPKAVVWLVPSVTIMEQTLKSLRDPAHPYRQRIDAHFQHRVEVFEKKQLLEGAGFSPTSVKEQLSILVLSFDSFRANNKEARKVYQENGALAAFVRHPVAIGTDNPYHNGSSLMNVIRQLNPVVIVDESHNATTELSVEMLDNLNPSFILELTATPRETSNIISYVDAFALKQEHMIKLPVIVYNHRDKTAVIQSALQLRQRLENKAIEAADKGHNVIRPIVLFQAESNTGDDRATFQKVKADLISLGIPEAEIKIKTANINEIKNVDLMAVDCPVRYIITVNALKEGWDCPFAYVLASLGARSSAVDVEQILGRVLRQPYARKNEETLLNLSYVLTASSRFSETLENIVTGLNRAGFSERDFKLAKNVKLDEDPLQTLMADRDDDPIDTIAIITNSDAELAAVTEIETTALASHRAYEMASSSHTRSGEALPSAFLRERARHFNMKEVFADVALEIKIPKLFTAMPPMQLFPEDFPWELLHKGKLLEKFPLSQADSQINVEQTQGDIMTIDAERTGPDRSMVSAKQVKGQLYDALADQIATMSAEDQREQLGQVMCNLVQQYLSIDDNEIRAYIKRIIAQLDASQLNDAIGRRYDYKRLIESKISSEATKFSEKMFYSMCDANEIHAIPNYKFPEFIVPHEVESRTPVANSLYQKETALNGFEHKVILAIASLPNVRFWHHIIPRKPNSFFLNGFINHYPDFIVVTKGRTLILVETKGDDRDNSDSKKKNRFGRRWAEKAGDGYKYFMIFREKQPEDTFVLSQALDQIAKLP